MAGELVGTDRQAPGAVVAVPATKPLSIGGESATAYSFEIT